MGKIISGGFIDSSAKIPQSKATLPRNAAAPNESQLLRTVEQAGAGLAKTGLGGFGDLFQGYMNVVEGLTGKPIALPNQQPAQNPFYTSQDIQEKVIKPYEEAYRRPGYLTQPEGKIQETVSSLSEDLPYILSGPGQLGAKLAGWAGGKIGQKAGKGVAEAVGLGESGQAVSGFLGDIFGSIGGATAASLKKPGNFRKLVQAEEKKAYARTKELGQKLTIPAKDLEDNINKSMSDLLGAERRIPVEDAKKVIKELRETERLIHQGKIKASDNESKKRLFNNLSKNERNPDIKNQWQLAAKMLDENLEKTKTVSPEFHKSLRQAESYTTGLKAKNAISKMLTESGKIEDISSALKNPLVQSLVVGLTGGVATKSLGKAVATGLGTAVLQPVAKYLSSSYDLLRNSPEVRKLAKQLVDTSIAGNTRQFIDVIKELDSITKQQKEKQLPQKGRIISGGLI